MVLPSVILQKPSATSKTKGHSVGIERTLALWRQGDLNMLMKEIRFIQDRFVNSKRARSVEDISRTGIIFIWLAFCKVSLSRETYGSDQIAG